MRLRSLPLRSALLLVLATPPSAHAQLAWQLAPIDELRGDDVQLAITAPVLGNDGVTYWRERVDPNGGGSSLYADPGGLLASDPRTMVEEDDFPLNQRPVDSDGGGSVLLLGHYFFDLPDPGGFAQTNALYAFPGLTRVAWFGTSFPGFTSDHTLQISALPSYDGTGGVVFQIRQQTVFPDFHYAIARVAGGGATLLVESGSTEVPGTGGATFGVLGTAVADGGVVLFYGEGGGRRGVYQWSAGAITTVVDNQTVLPPNASPVSIFDSSDVAFANHGTDVALVLTEFNGGVWKRIGGVWTQVIARNAPIPGGTGGMSDLGAPSIRDGAIAFFGGRNNQFSPPKQAGLYTDLGGVLHPIVDLQTVYGGDVPDRYEVAGNGRWFDGMEVAFAVQDAGADWRALYRATPAPEANGPIAALTAFVALLALSGRRDRARSR